MKPFRRLRATAPWAGALLVLMASLALGACDNDVKITGPQLPDFDPDNTFGGSTWVTATLTPEQGGCTEARLLFDGKQIGVKYDVCGLEGKGCGELKVQGFTSEEPGWHTIEVQVMHQTSAEVTYRVAVEVSDKPGGPVQVRPAPVSRTLGEGDSVAFEVELP